MKWWDYEQYVFYTKWCEEADKKWEEDVVFGKKLRKRWEKLKKNKKFCNLCLNTSVTSVSS